MHTFPEAKEIALCWYVSLVTKVAQHNFGIVSSVGLPDEQSALVLHDTAMLAAAPLSTNLSKYQESPLFESEDVLMKRRLSVL